MVRSKCPRCEGTSFELAEATPKGSRFKLYFVQCGSCGTVVSSEEWANTEALFEEPLAILKRLERSVGQLAEQVMQLRDEIRRGT